MDEDPDTILWLSDRMRALVEELFDDDRVMDLIRKKATSDDDFETGCWTVLYMKFVESGSTEELNEAVTVLKAWNNGARANRMDEWSMKLRLR